MKTLYVRNVPEPVLLRLERLAARAGLSLSAFVVRELEESSRRADNAALLDPLPDLPIPSGCIVAALAEERSER